MTPRSSTPDMRERILSAAATMLAENPAARLSVRAVAQRAGISTGSLRHVFPSQRDLIDAVVAGIASLEAAQPVEESLRDTSRPAVDRLVDLLRSTLADVLADDRATALLRSTIAAPEPTSADDLAPGLALERLALHRMAGWVETLHSEHDSDGAAPEQLLFDAPSGARFLSTVLNGLVMETVLPGSLSRVASHDEILRIAATAVLTTRA